MTGLVCTELGRSAFSFSAPTTLDICILAIYFVIRHYFVSLCHLKVLLDIIVNNGQPSMIFELRYR